MESLTTESGKAVTCPTPHTTAWGTEGVSSKDLVIPKIQLIQASSNLCKEGIARPGDLVHSLTKEIMSPKGDKLELLPILCVGSWIVSTPKPATGGFGKFIRKEALTLHNDSDVWKHEEFENNEPVIRTKCLTYLVLPVNAANGFPFFLEFQNTNKNGGKLLSTIMQENKFSGRPGPARVVGISTSLKTYNGNSWFTLGVAPLRDSTDMELAACKKWYDLFSKVQFKEAEESEEPVPF